MGDKKTLTMARKELEEMYVGVADDSVNLSFQELAQVMHKNVEKKKLPPSSTMAAISESGQSEPALAKLPSLDFSRALQHASLNNHQHHHVDVHSHHAHHHGAGVRSPASMDQRSFTYDDMSHVSDMSSVAAYGGRGGGGRRRRPGIPHSNICAVCSTYTYIFRHRCLVCGRVYCRQCVAIGMGEMKEGRKCIDCLGRRFSQRYINKAGNVGCCLGYPSTVKQQELKWAEKGPRTRPEAAHGHRTTGLPPTPTSHHHSPNPPSSPYANNSHHFLPL
ncbi:uncharacterized protein LOC130992094 [Salvia miltiorrhiza]|uniref:uncharacterized protein LOC130992094 n=1 Tax=Salvia miltiorrhiza TaxID=226208 RepID=UPI0025AD3540|nr:uncharacterized protein LOC130992094 [Salvia miltiorrhiza]